MHDGRESQDCCKRTVCGNIDVQSDEGSERKEESQRDSLLLREYINNHEQNVGRKYGCSSPVW